MNRKAAASLLFVPLLFACSSTADRTAPGGAVEAPGAGGVPGVAGTSSGGPPAASAGSGNALNVDPGPRPDASDIMVEVFGAWCEGIKNATANSVNFVLGCPGEVIQ